MDDKPSAALWLVVLVIAFAVAIVINCSGI